MSSLKRGYEQNEHEIKLSTHRQFIIVLYVYGQCLLNYVASSLCNDFCKSACAISTRSYLRYIKNEHQIFNMTRLIVTPEYLDHKWPRISSACRNHNPVLSSFMPYHRVCNKSKKTVALESPPPPPRPEMIGSCCSIFIFLVMLCGSLFVLFLLATMLSVLHCEFESRSWLSVLYAT